MTSTSATVLRRVILDGEILSEEEITLSASDLLSTLEPETLVRVINIGAGFVQQAGPLWDALVLMSEDDPAYRAIQIVTDVALTAALEST